MKKILIGAIVGALFLAGISAYLMFRPNPVTNSSTETSSLENAKESEEVQYEPFSGVDSLMNLLVLPGAYECTMSLNIDSGVPTATEGTFFFSNGKLRSDMVVDAMGTKVVTSVIIKDGVSYSWSDMDGVTQGVKIQLDKYTEAAVEGSTVTPKEMETIESAIKYDCKPWSSKDDSVFELPQDILFKDFEELMNVGMEDGTVFQNQCSACENLSGEAKEQCRAFMSCE